MGNLGQCESSPAKRCTGKLGRGQPIVQQLVAQLAYDAVTSSPAKHRSLLS